MDECKIITELKSSLKNIELEMAGIGPVLFGSIKVNTNKRKRKDGSIYVSQPYYTFVYRSEVGKESWKRINSKHLPEIERMKKNGDRYRELSTRHRSIMTQLNLLRTGKKNS